MQSIDLGALLRVNLEASPLQLLMEKIIAELSEQKQSIQAVGMSILMCLFSA